MLQPASMRTEHLEMSQLIFPERLYINLESKIQSCLEKELYPTSIKAQHVHCLSPHYSCYGKMKG